MQLLKNLLLKVSLFGNNNDFFYMLLLDNEMQHLNFKNKVRRLCFTSHKSSTNAKTYINVTQAHPQISAMGCKQIPLHLPYCSNDVSAQRSSTAWSARIPVFGKVWKQYLSTALYRSNDQ